MRECRVHRLSRSLLAAGAGYLLGTLPSARLAARLAAGERDLRSEGSGNPGALNAAMVLGRRWGAAVLVADMGKGVAATLLGRRLAGEGGAFAAATAAVAGHVMPAWDPAGGGKGVATSAGATLALFPAFFPLELAVGVAGGLRYRRTRLATEAACGALVVGAVAARRWRLPNAWGPPPSTAMVAWAAASAALVVWAFERAGAPGRAEPSGAR